MARLVETVAPRRLGAGFRWLIASSWATNLGDGLALAAGPLLVASHTHDALVVSLAAVSQWLPPLLLGLYAGALSDRLDRRMIVVSVNLTRAAVLLVLSGLIVSHLVSVPIVLAALFLLGTAEVFADNTTSTLMPMVVPAARVRLRRTGSARGRGWAGPHGARERGRRVAGTALWVVGSAGLRRGQAP